MKTNISILSYFFISFIVNLSICLKSTNFKENLLNVIKNNDKSNNNNNNRNELLSSLSKINLSNELKQIKELSRGIASLSIIPTDDSGMINTKLSETKMFYSFGLDSKQFKIKTNSNDKLLLNSQTSNLITRSLYLNTLSIFNSFIYIYKYKVLTEVKNNNQNATDSNLLASQGSNPKQKSYEFIDQQIQQTQWRMFISDNFDKNNTDYGWNYLYTTTCGKYLNMLGGFNQVSVKKLEKTISYLPRHQFVMIEMNVYMLGKWNGESLYVQVDTNEAKYDPQYYFTTRCTYPKKKQMLNGCLDRDYCRIREKVRINLKHFGNYLKIIVGTTLESSPDIKSYGISDFRLYIK